METAVSSFDTVIGNLDFNSMKPGSYEVVVRYGEERLSSKSIEILSYAKPAYMISAEPDRREVFAGEKVTYKVKAGFFDNTSVAGLRLRYSGYWNKEIAGEIALDDNGEGSFTFIPEYYEEKEPYYPKSFDLTFSPKDGEEGDISATAGVQVFGPDIHIQSYSRKIDKDGNPGKYELSAKLNKIDISGMDGQNGEYLSDPVTGYPIQAEIIRISYLARESGEYYDPICRCVKKIFSYEQKEETVEKAVGKTDGNGEWKFERELKRTGNVSYRIIFSGVDSKKRKFQSIAYDQYYLYGGSEELSVSLSLPKDREDYNFSVGEPIELSLDIANGKLADATSILYYRTGRKIDRKEVSRDFTFFDEFKKDFMPSVQYQAVMLGPSGFIETNQVAASYKETDSEIELEITPDKEKYKPGERAVLDLKAQAKGGQPVDGEINISVVDEALFHILPYDFRQEILPTLYSDIYTPAITGFSNFEQRRGGAEFGGCFLAGTMIATDRGARPIEDLKPGDRIITREKEKEAGESVPAVIQGISTHNVDGYIVINKQLRLTPEHTIFINGKWAPAGSARLKDRLSSANGSAVEISSIEYVRAEKIPVYNIVVGRYHTYLADGFFVHNAEKGGRARINFADVAYFGTLRAVNGSAGPVSFTLPDSITSYRVTAAAFDPLNMLAGEKIKLLPVSLPLFIDSTLVPGYLSGDSPILRIRLYGDGYEKGKDSQVSVEIPTLGIDKSEKVSGQTFTLALGPLPEGRHKIEISAKQGENEDKIVREFKALSSHFRSFETRSYPVVEGPASFEGYEAGLTEVVFTDSGSGPFYNELSDMSAQEGIRIDQRAAAYVAKTLLEKHFKEDRVSEKIDSLPYLQENGGLSLFPYSEADLEVSALLADLLPEQVFKNDLTSYFNSSLSDKKSDITRIARSLYGLASLREPVLTKLDKVSRDNRAGTLDQIFFGLAYAKLGAKDEACKIYSGKVRELLRIEGEGAYISGQEGDRRIKLTAAAGMLSAYCAEDDSDRLWEYLSLNRPEKTLDLLERVLIARNRLAGYQAVKTRFNYSAGAKSESIELGHGEGRGLILDRQELDSLSFSSVSGEITALVRFERTKDPKEIKKDSTISISRKYLKNGKEIKEAASGDKVLIRIAPKTDKKSSEQNYQIIDRLPAGLKPSIRTYDASFDPEEGDICNPIFYPALTEDNGVYFVIDKNFNFDEKACPERTINYYARAVVEGEFSAEPAMIQRMNDIRKINISDKSSITIK